MNSEITTREQELVSAVALFDAAVSVQHEAIKHLGVVGESNAHVEDVMVAMTKLYWNLRIDLIDAAEDAFSAGLSPIAIGRILRTYAYTLDLQHLVIPADLSK